MKTILIISLSTMVTLISTSEITNESNEPNIGDNSLASVNCTSDEYSYDETPNKNRCTNDCMCAGERTCS